MNDTGKNQVSIFGRDKNVFLQSVQIASTYVLDIPFALDIT